MAKKMKKMKRLNIDDIAIETHFRALQNVQKINKSLSSYIEQVNASEDRPSKDRIIEASELMDDLQIIEDLLLSSNLPHIHSGEREDKAIDIQDKICRLYDIDKIIEI